MDISYNHCYSYRVDIVEEEGIVDKFVQYILDGKNVKYYVGELEYAPDTGKPHMQMCLMFDEQPKRHQFMNVKTRKWVAKTKQPVAFTKARNEESLKSYCTKDNTDQLISNMTQEQRKSIKPWKKQEHCKGCNCKAYKRTEYIIDYIKKLLKDMKTKEYEEYEKYMKSYPGYDQKGLEDYYEKTGYDVYTADKYTPTSSECKKLLATAHAHYFEKYDKHICRPTLIKIMLKTKMITHEQYIEKTLGNLLSEEYV